MSGRVSSQMQSLDFTEKLVEKGKRESTDALLKKLKTLHQKMTALEQDQTEIKSLDPYRKPLISQVILHHKDRGVKAYAACCLADMLRLYAPDAPYTGEELRDIFQFFSAQLLSNLRPAINPTRPLQPSRRGTNQETQSQTQGSQRVTDVPYYTEYCYLLESLATIKSIVLACDVPGGEELVTEFFEGFVQIVRSDMSKNIIKHLTIILTCLLDESSTVPPGVLDCIIDQFTNHASTDVPSFLLIVDVCNGAPGRLQRPVFAHFAELQLQHGKNPTTEDVEALNESHVVLLSMWRHSPEILLGAIQLLHENLQLADQVELRNLTTRTLGSMFGSRPRVGQAQADLIKSQPAAWKAWLGRRLDKSVQVRVTWAEASYEVLANAPDIRSVLEQELVDRVTDSSEHVRAAICATIGKLDYETTLHSIHTDTLRSIGYRMSDKKAIVRSEAVNALTKLWSSAYTEIEQNDPKAIRQFAWIPQAMLLAFAAADAPVELRTFVSGKFKERILPLPAKPDDEQAWVERILLVRSHLEEDAAKKALDRLTSLIGYASGAYPYRAFITFCEENNGGVIEKDEDEVKARLSYVVNAIATFLFADVEKAKSDMMTFANENDNRLYKLFKTCTDTKTDLRSLIKAKNELLRRIEQGHTSILDTFTVILQHASFNMLNTSSISPLLKTLQSPPGGDHTGPIPVAAASYLQLIAKECPPMYEKHLPELLICIGQQKNERLVEVALQALASVCKYDQTLAPKDKKNVDKVMKIALNGTPRQAKFAARYMSYCGQDDASGKLINAILGKLEERDEDLLLTHLRALCELALSSPKALEAKAEEVHEFVMREVIHQKSTSSEDDTADEWKEEDQLDAIDRAKIIGLRLVTHRAIGFARDPEALTVAEPVFELLEGILRTEGQISDRTLEGGYARTQIRLRAALCLLKLAQVRAFDRKMTRFLEPISYVMQDPCYQVRHRLLIKLGELLPAQRMYPRWNMMPAMIATDPERDNPTMARTIISNCVKGTRHIPSPDRIDRIEMPLARLLLVLAHHPDLVEWDYTITQDMAKYIDLYVSCVVNRDNIGLLYHIAAKIKSVKGLLPNGEPEEDNTNLYKLAEVTQIIIRNKAEQHHWNLTSYPGKVKMPSDCFHNLQNNQIVLESTRKAYLTEEETTWAKGLGRKNAAAGPSRRVEPGSSPVKRKPKTPRAPRKRVRRSKSGETSDESEVDDEDEDMEDAEDAAEEVSDEEEEAEEEGEAVEGRGGRRGAKTKAKKGLKPKKRVKAAKPMKAKDGKVAKRAKRGQSSDTGAESDLTDLAEE